MNQNDLKADKRSDVFDALPIRMSAKRKEAIINLVISGKANSVQHALILEAVRYVKLPEQNNSVRIG